MEKKPQDYFRFGDPKGEEGRKTLENMNLQHKELSEWAMSLLPEMRPEGILDVGCGGGMQMKMLGDKFPKAHLTGVDISEESVRFALNYNKDKVSSGLCRVDQAPAEELPYPDKTFDLVSAFETYFFWTDPVTAFREIYRVLRPNGILMVISEQYPHPNFEERNKKVADRTGLKLIDNEELLSILIDAGFKVEYTTLPEKNWVCFIANK
ncbi:MAG TPA: class I SAM-dependent methyltransferase [Candidatus Methanomethylophilaceae archaeon]|nr:class I SAM-dependent methyltransferase [Candidatus Methanomethylophilaceae archaeon]